MAGDRFLGVTKFQFGMLVSMAVLVLVLAANAYTGHRQTDLKAEQQRVATYLCDMTNGAWRERGRIIDGLVVAAIKQVQVELASDRTRRPELVEQDMRFLDTFNIYHSQLEIELAYHDPNCSKGAR